MSYITGAIYPSSDRPQLGATEEETLRAYADENTAVALGYANPDIHELHALQKTFNLHELAIEDAGRGHQRAKLERYGDSLFTVIRPAIYLDKEEEVRLSELHLFTGPRYTLALVRDEQRINDKFNLLYAPPAAAPVALCVGGLRALPPWTPRCGALLHLTMCTPPSDDVYSSI